MNRLVSVQEASAYCSLSPSAFKAWLRRIGLKIKVKGANKYDLQALDHALNKLSGLSEPEQPKSDFSADMKKVNRDATIPRRHKHH